MTARILLGRGLFAVVDEADLELLAGYSWHPTKGGPYGKWYAKAALVCPGDKRKKTIKMHRLIMGAAPGIQVDHKDGDGLNNRRENLRVCTHSQNGGNRKASSNSTTGFKGVSVDRRYGKFTAAICANKKSVRLGYFKYAEDAARAYDAKAKELFGEFANLNFPEASDTTGLQGGKP